MKLLGRTTYFVSRKVERDNCSINLLHCSSVALPTPLAEREFSLGQIKNEYAGGIFVLGRGGWKGRLREDAPGEGGAEDETASDYQSTRLDAQLACTGRGVSDRPLNHPVETFPIS